MSDCKKFQDLISQKLDGELSEQEELELDAHLGSCPSCRTLLEIYSSVFTDEELIEPPSALSENVMSQIRAQKKNTSKNRHIFIRYAAGIAACIALAIFAAPRLFTGSKSDDAKMDYSEFHQDIVLAESESCDTDDGMAEYSAGAESADMAKTNMPDAFIDGGGEPMAEPYMVGSDSLADAQSFCAVVRINGAYPELLSGYTLFPSSRDTYTAYITYSDAQTLESSGYDVRYASEDGNAPCDVALVVYAP